MRKPLLAALIAVTLVGACGNGRQSSFRPFAWLKGPSAAQSTTLAPKGGYPNPNGNRVPVADVVQMQVERVPGGLIIRATGLAPSQGWWDAGLIAQNEGQPVKGVLTFDFDVAPPVGPTDVSTPQSREVTVATYRSDIQLQDVRQIKIVGAHNSRTSRR